MPTHILKVIAISKNTNSFGLKQFKLIDDTGQVFVAHANDLNLPQQFQAFKIETEIGQPIKTGDLVRFNWEVISREGQTTQTTTEKFGLIWNPFGLISEVTQIVFDIFVEIGQVNDFEDHLNVNRTETSVINWEVRRAHEGGVEFRILFCDLDAMWRFAYRWGRLQ